MQGCTACNSPCSSLHLSFLAVLLLAVLLLTLVLLPTPLPARLPFPLQARLLPSWPGAAFSAAAPRVLMPCTAAPLRSLKVLTVALLPIFALGSLLLLSSLSALLLVLLSSSSLLSLPLPASVAAFAVAGRFLVCTAPWWRQLLPQAPTPSS